MEERRRLLREEVVAIRLLLEQFVEDIYDIFNHPTHSSVPFMSEIIVRI